MGGREDDTLKENPEGSKFWEYKEKGSLKGEDLVNAKQAIEGEQC